MGRALDSLFPRTRQAILASTLLDPERSWYLSDLAKHIGVPPSSLQRDLANLVAAGILSRREEGNRVYFRPDRSCPFLSELTGLLMKTAGLKDLVSEALHPFRSRIKVAFIYGSVARGAERSESDLDLLIVGDVSLAVISPSLRKLEENLSRPVNATVFSPTEFAEKVAKAHHFLRSVLDKEKLYVVGTGHELEEARGRTPARAPRHKQARTR